MKKSFLVFVLAGLIVSIGLSLLSTRVTAAGVANGSWSKGTEVALDLKPNAELQNFGSGVVVTAPGEICHEFSGGRFGWVASIRKWIDGAWVKIPTTQGWVPNTEGSYMACAQAPSAGTYGLFAYYIRPENAQDDAPAGLPICKDVTIHGNIGYYSKEDEEVIRLNFFSGITPGDAWTFEILSITDLLGDPVVVDTYTNDLEYDSENVMYTKSLIVSTEVENLTLRVNTPTCYVDVNLSKPVD